MKVAIVTPLYPPDIAQTASYVKELGTRLRERHEVTILTYGHAPEKIPNVTIHAVNKRSPLFLRMFRFSVDLFSVAKRNDVLFVINGPSVELPLALVSLFTSTSSVFQIADPGAHTYTQKHILRHTIESFVKRKARVVGETIPHPKPERLPFTEVSAETFSAYTDSWNEHLQYVEKALEQSATSPI